VSLLLDDFHKDLSRFIFFLEISFNNLFCYRYQGYYDVVCKSITIVQQQCFGTNFSICHYGFHVEFS